MKIKVAALAASFALSLVGAATEATTTLVSDTFSYANGPLDGKGGWAAYRERGASKPFINNGRVIFAHKNFLAEDVRIALKPVSTGVLTASFDLSVFDHDNIFGPPDDIDYFAHFFKQSNPDYLNRARIYANTPSQGGNYSIRVSTERRSRLNQFTPVDFRYWDWIPVELSFNFALGQASVTAGGHTIYGDAGYFGETLDAFALRQTNSTNDESFSIDNLVITHDDGVPATPSPVPVPASVLLLISGVMGLGRMRRPCRHERAS